MTAFFLDESFGRQLAGMERSRDIFSSFTFLAVLIACLGLFGMSAYAAEQRTKEIGVRKVLGSSSSQIVYLLSREVMVHLAAAAVISWPVIYFLMNRWLRNFPYRADLSLWTFVVAFLLVFIIGLATVAFQSVKASLANPVDSLRYE